MAFPNSHKSKEYIVYFVLSEKCSAPLSEVLQRTLQQGDGGEEEEGEDELVDSINSLGAFLLINGFVPIDKSREHVLKYYDYERISAYYAYQGYGKDQEALQEYLKKGKLPIRVILGTTCVDYHWYDCSSGRLKVLENGQIMNGNNPRSSNDEDDATSTTPSTSPCSTIRLTSDIFTKFLKARGVRGDITGRNIHRLANSFLPKCWSLKRQAGEHLSRPDSFAKYPLLVFFNVFEEMLYLCITSTVSDQPYSTMDQAYIEEYMKSSLHTNSHFFITDHGKPNALSERMFFIQRFVSIIINSLFSLNSIIRKFYPQHVTEVNRIFKTVNDDIRNLYRSIKAEDSLVANQSNCSWVISHLYSCRNHAIRIKGCYLEATYGFKTMKLLSKLVDQEYVRLLETEGVENCIDFNEEKREQLFDLDETSADISNNNSFYLVATSQVDYETTAKVYGNHNCRIPDKEYRHMMNNDDGNRKQRVLDYIKTKRVMFFNFAVMSLHADIFRRMTWPVLEDISKSLGQAATGGSLLSNQLRPTFNYFMTRHIQALLGCEVCSRNVSKKFSSCIRFLNDAQKASGLLPYFRAFRCLPSFSEKEFAWIQQDSFSKMLSGSPADPLRPEIAIEMLLDMVLKADFPAELRSRFVRKLNKISKEEVSQLTQTGQGDVRYGEHLQRQLERDFKAYRLALRTQMSQKLMALMDKVQDVYSFVFIFFLALSQELEYIVTPKGVSQLQLSNRTDEYRTDNALVNALKGSADSPNNFLTTRIDSMSKMEGISFDLADRYPLNCRIKLVDKMPDGMEVETGGGVNSEDIILMEVPVQVSTKTADYNALTSLRMDKEVADLGGHKWFLYNGGNIITEEMVAAAEATPNSKVERINMVVMDRNSAGLLYNYCLAVAIWAMRNTVRLSNNQNPFPLAYVLKNRQVNVKTPYPTKTGADGRIDQVIMGDLVPEIASGVRKVVRALGVPGINLMVRKNFKAQMIADLYDKMLASDTH